MTASSRGRTPRQDRPQRRSSTPHDCVVSKLVAFRDKDRAFAAALLREGIVSAATLRERIGALPEDVDARAPQAILAWLAANDRAPSPLNVPGAVLEES